MSRVALLVAGTALILAAIPASAAARPTVQILGSGSSKVLDYQAGSLDGSNDPNFAIRGRQLRDR